MAGQKDREELDLSAPSGQLELTLQLQLDVNDAAQLRSVVHDLHSALPDEKWRALVILCDQVVKESLSERGLVTVVQHLGD